MLYLYTACNNEENAWTKAIRKHKWLNPKTLYCAKEIHTKKWGIRKHSLFTPFKYKSKYGQNFYCWKSKWEFGKKGMFFWLKGSHMSWAGNVPFLHLSSDFSRAFSLLKISLIVIIGPVSHYILQFHKKRQ